MKLLLYIKRCLIITLLTHECDILWPIPILEMLECLRQFPPTDLTGLEACEYLRANLLPGRPKSLRDCTSDQGMLVNNKVIALLAEHVVLALLALVVGLLLAEGMAAVVAEEPVVAGLLLLLVDYLFVLVLLQLQKDVLSQLCALCLGLPSELLLLLLLALLGLLSLVLTRLAVASQRFLDLAWVLH